MSDDNLPELPSTLANLSVVNLSEMRSWRTAGENTKSIEENILRQEARRSAARVQEEELEQQQQQQQQQQQSRKSKHAVGSLFDHIFVRPIAPRDTCLKYEKFTKYLPLLKNTERAHDRGETSVATHMRNATVLTKSYQKYRRMDPNQLLASYQDKVRLRGMAENFLSEEGEKSAMGGTSERKKLASIVQRTLSSLEGNTFSLSNREKYQCFHSKFKEPMTRRKKRRKKKRTAKGTKRGGGGGVQRRKKNGEMLEGGRATVDLGKEEAEGVLELDVSLKEEEDRDEEDEEDRDEYEEDKEMKQQTFEQQRNAIDNQPVQVGVLVRTGTFSVL